MGGTPEGLLKSDNQPDSRLASGPLTAQLHSGAQLTLLRQGRRPPPPVGFGSQRRCFQQSKTAVFIRPFTKCASSAIKHSLPSQKEKRKYLSFIAASS